MELGWEEWGGQTKRRELQGRTKGREGKISREGGVSRGKRG